MKGRMTHTLTVALTLMGLTTGMISRAHAQQFTAWFTPQNLGPVINSAFSESHPAISKDGLSLYFTSTRPGVGGDDIWVAQRDTLDSPWGEPQNLGALINTSFNDRVPAFSPDGHRMYFGSTRPGGCGGLDIWVSRRKDKRDDFGWEAPINLGCILNSTADDDGPTYFEDESTGKTTLYFTSLRTGGLGDFDIYSSELGPDGVFGPGVLVTELSGPTRDTRTTIRRDGLEMFLTSDRTGSLGGLDLWMSTRAATTDSWSAPVNLGPGINTASSDGAPALSFDGTTLYFYSNRPGGVGGNDLYVATRSKVGDQQ